MKCQWSLNSLRFLTGAFWGAGRMVVFRLYWCLISSWLDCRSFIYAFASKRIVFFSWSYPHLGNASLQGPLRQAEWEVCMQNQGNMYMLHTSRSYCVVMQEGWVLLRDTPAMEPHTLPLSKEGLLLIQRQAIQQASCVWSSWMHSHVSISHHHFQNPHHSICIIVSTHYDTRLCDLSKIHAPLETFKFCTDMIRDYPCYVCFYRWICDEWIDQWWF